MSDHASFDENASRRTYTAPYTAHHPIPTVQDYEAKRQDRDQSGYPKDNDSLNVDKTSGLIAAAKERLLFSHANTNDMSANQRPYESANRNLAESSNTGGPSEDSSPASAHETSPQDTSGIENLESVKDTSQAVITTNDPQQKRKIMKKIARDHKGREVTDPITHLPVTIHDATDTELGSVPGKNNVLTEHAAGGKDYHHEQQDTREQQAAHCGMEALFPPPNLEACGERLASIASTAFTVGLISLLGVLLLLLLAGLVYYDRFPKDRSPGQTHSWSHILLTLAVALLLAGVAAFPIVWGIQSWVAKKVTAAWEDGIWDAAQTREQQTGESSLPESVQWLNSLLASVWPLINPDLFTSLADTLEDVMQASLPKLVRMISIEDLGQGNEAIRVLGIKWLPTANAKKDVSVNGQVQESPRTQESGGKVPNKDELNSDIGRHYSKGNPPNHASKSQGKDFNAQGEDQAIAEGLEAEEGDFVNVEVGFSYRASTTGKSMRVKAKNAHLYLLFYLPGGMQFRQPRVNLSCVPLTRKGLNIMDLPIISSFVQSSIDAALAEYVAPKSLTLDLKDMLVGDDFKKDTRACGVLVVTIVNATGFKEGDRSLGGLKKGSSDAYVALAWAKFGKPLWSTRIILDDMRPSWNETAYVLVSPEEIDASERLRVQLWDSDRTSADDDLGRIEVDLKQLMSDSRSLSRMWQREDRFQALTPSKDMPGNLVWKVGYFPKKRIQQTQLDRQTIEPEIRSLQELKDKVARDVGQKMREASNLKKTPEFNQQEAQDLKIREGLQLERINRPRNDEDIEGEIAEGSDELPSSYCTVILNHQKIFKTRTKPKSSNPFFNAATERFIRDVSQRLDFATKSMESQSSSQSTYYTCFRLGLVHLPLHRVFETRSQVVDYYPIVGGIGYGRARISLVFRSVQLRLPPNLLGWDCGTIEITACATHPEQLSASLHELRLKLRTSVGRGKMYRAVDGGGQLRWQGKKNKPIRLAVQQRYRSCLVIEFRKNRLGLDQTPAFAILWLQHVNDEQKQSLTLSVFSGNRGDLERAQSNYFCDLGEPKGSIVVTLKLFRGLGRYHRRLAKSNDNVDDVLEVLDTAMDSREVQDSMAETDNNSDDSSSSESSNSERDDSKGNGFRSGLRATLGGDKGVEDKGHSPLQGLQDYDDHSEQLHRHHRGLMQWKVGRQSSLRR
ncbi:MAG: hypothetical protein Q9209_007519 [Squamulea sp. 1 TL-2023]